MRGGTEPELLMHFGLFHSGTRQKVPRQHLVKGEKGGKPIVTAHLGYFSVARRCEGKTAEGITGQYTTESTILTLAAATNGLIMVSLVEETYCRYGE